MDVGGVIGADQRDDLRGVGEQPSEGELAGRGAAVGGGHLAQGIQGALDGGVRVARDLAPARKPAAAEGAVGQGRDAEFQALIQDAVAGIAGGGLARCRPARRAFVDGVEAQERDGNLVGDDGCLEVLLESQGLLRVVVGNADGLDQALSHHVIQNGGGLGGVGQRVRPVELVQVGVVNAHAGERPAQARADVLGGVVVVAGPDPDFGSDEDLFAATGDGGEALFEDGLASGAAVDVGVVIKGDAGFECGFKGGDGLALVLGADFGGVPGAGQPHTPKGDA